MDLRTLISLVSVMLSAVLNTVASAPASDAPAASLVSHVRNKRCSCATLLDKECVYFCHLDIIWVNTPERVVSYGLGNTQRRRRRSVGGSGANRAGSRCTCLRGHDSTCNNFCQPQHRLRYNKATPRAQGEGCSGAGCARTPTAAAARMKRSDPTKPASPVALRGVAKARAVLQAWRRRRRRGAGGEGEEEEEEEEKS